MVDIHSATAKIRRGKKEEEEEKETTGQNIMFASAMQGGHKNLISITVSVVNLL